MNKKLILPAIFLIGDELLVRVKEDSQKRESNPVGKVYRTISGELFNKICSRPNGSEIFRI